MLATLGGTLALLVGLAVLLLPLLLPELSRARDSVWGAVVLLLGLALVTSAERLTGSPMLVVLCGGLLIGRLGTEVGRARWLQLTAEERQQLLAAERWQRSFAQLITTGQRLLSGSSALLGGLLAGVKTWRSPKASSKRWVRQEESAEASEAPEQNGDAADGVTVTSFAEIDVLIHAASGSETDSASSSDLVPASASEAEGADPSDVVPADGAG